MTEKLPDPDPGADVPADLIPFTRAARLLQASMGAVHRWRLAGRFRAWRRCGRWFASERELRALFVETGGRPARAKRVPALTERQRLKEEQRIQEGLRRHGLA
jgi:hypothetical protein